MADFLLHLLGFFGIAAVVIAGATTIVFRREILAAWRGLKAERATPEAPSEPPSTRAGWWCQQCEREVQPVEVTYEETHDPRSGGCGSALTERTFGVTGTSSDQGEQR